MLTSVIKGDALEKAVSLVERTILGSTPSLKEATITIEPKKVIIVNGVKHEIDLFVTIDHGKGYKLIFIFECKNWDKGVGKNEIVNFSEKIKVTQAQKGYFVAKRFGKYAKPQAVQDDRIELLEADDNFDGIPEFISTLHVLGINPVNTHLDFKVAATDQQKIDQFTLTDESIIQIRGENKVFKDLLDEFRNFIINEKMKSEQTDIFSEGKYNYDNIAQFNFQPGDLYANGCSVLQIDIKVTWEAYVARPKIISKFDIKTRGRVHTFEDIKLPNGEKLQISIIMAI